MKIQILIIGRNEEIVQTLMRLINNNNQWEGRSVLTDEAAITLFDNFHFDIVLLSSGISEISETMLCNYFRKKNTGIKIIQHYGGGSGLLSNEIQQALKEPAV